MKRRASTILSALILALCSMGVGECSCVPSEGNANHADGRINTTAANSSATVFVAVAVGNNGRIYSTRDSTRGRGPLTWTPQNSGTAAHLNFAKFAPGVPLRVFVVGNSGTILQSLNGGVSWAPLPSGTTRNINAISFATSTDGYAVGDSGLILKTVDAGTSWTALTSGTTRRLRAVYAGFNLVAAGEGTILKSSDGTTWSERFFNVSKTFNRIAESYDLATGIVIWVVGNGGAMYSSVNQGQSWISRASGTTTNLNDVQFLNDLRTGVAVGDSGRVRHTTNGGTTWLADTYLNSRTTSNITSIFPIVYRSNSKSHADTTITGIVIAGNSLFTVSSGPLTDVFESHQTLPHAITLHQNYPNPFNPSTRIQFSIPSANGRGGELEKVSLTVFDALGSEVATLVNENLPAGEYTRTFDGVGIASGVYFSQLRVGSFSETKKMILTR